MAAVWLFALAFNNPPSIAESGVGRTASVNETSQAAAKLKVKRRQAEESARAEAERNRFAEKSRETSASASWNAPTPDELSGAFNTVDKILNRLPSGNIAFNTPPAMNLTDTAIIQLKLDLATSIDELKRTIEAEGQKEGARIKVADRMEARLSGPNFAITQITRDEQAIAQGHVTEWKWEVKPTAEGRHHLHLTLSALLNIGGNSTPRAIRTFDKFIVVEVTWPQRVSSFVQGNWQWLWAVFLAPFAGWGWNRWSGSKGRNPEK